MIALILLNHQWITHLFKWVRFWIMQKTNYLTMSIIYYRFLWGLIFNTLFLIDRYILSWTFYQRLEEHHPHLSLLGSFSWYFLVINFSTLLYYSIFIRVKMLTLIKKIMDKLKSIKQIKMALNQVLVIGWGISKLLSLILIF